MIALQLLGQWRSSQRAGLIFIAEDERRAEQLGAILHALAPECGVLVFPALDVLPSDDLEPSPEISGRRASVLRRLAQTPQGRLLVTTAEALLPRVPGIEAAAATCFRLRRGDRFEEERLREFLESAGYSLGEPAELPGNALFLGQMVEIYPAGALGPVRLEIADAEVSAIRFYEADTQRVVTEADELVLDPLSEGSWCKGELPQATGLAERNRQHALTLLDYLPAAAVIADDGFEERAEHWFRQLDETGSDGDIRKARFLDREGWKAALGRRKFKSLPTPMFEAVPSFVSKRSAARSLRDFLAVQQREGRRVIFTAASEDDLRVMDRRTGASSKRCDKWLAATAENIRNRTALIVDLEAGFVDLRQKLAVVTASDVLGSRASHQLPIGVAANRDIDTDADLTPGDAVIHMDRGLAILHGLVSVEAEGLPQSEMIRLEFADKKIVLAPLAELRSVWRYSSNPTAVTLDKADGSSWAARRDKVEQEIAETASHLAKLAAERRKRTAPKIVPPVADYERFVASFRYFPTPDQRQAIEDVLADLASGHPMDRLVCGDVGYGKTEVALRAAAAAVLAGKQAAIAAPTTVLARQHVETFRGRFSRLGVDVGELSRFVPPAEARSVKKRLTDGSLKLVVGTHALAGKGIRFQDLGLVVIDEEQRFGVADKARLSKLAKDAHLLTLSATPIPRTMSQAYAGIRPISIITTPPVRRIPVKTIVGPFDAAAVAAALRREHRRRGQSFVVCPRVEDIEAMRRRLDSMVPELRITTVHGKMPAAEIDAGMTDFAGRKSDVLLTTNIIESGLDMPRANTMVVWRPDRFGLAQLHQLRGRVGRGSTRAFALFLSDPEAPLSEASRKRLDLLHEFSRPGAGLSISYGDMDLRGGGDLLSERQSGHVKVLGPALFRRLVDRMLRRAGDNPGLAVTRAQLQLEMPVSLPAKFIKDDATRLEIYAQISKCETVGELDRIEDRMFERFGDLPEQALEFLEVNRIELDCQRLGIAVITAGPDSIAAKLQEGSRPPLRARELIWKDGRIIYRRRSTPPDRLQAVRDFIDLLET